MELVFHHDLAAETEIHAWRCRGVNPLQHLGIKGVVDVLRSVAVFPEMFDEFRDTGQHDVVFTKNRWVIVWRTTPTDNQAD